jgi:hypothetical protein
MASKPTRPERVVLVLVKNGDKVLDSGSGLVLCHDSLNKSTFVLTCAHNLRATSRRLESAIGSAPRRRIESGIESAVKVLVNGQVAHTIEDEKLRFYDLALLKIPQVDRPAAQLKVTTENGSTVRCEGFVPFIHQEYAHETVTGEVKSLVRTLNPDGESVSYLKIHSSKRGPRFKKGFSGGPVFDANGKLVGMARILQAPERGEVLGYAIQFSTEIVGLLSEVVTPCDIVVVGGTSVAQDRPPAPPEPLPESLRSDDIQKNRWGGKSAGWGYQLSIQNVELHRRYFLFDAVLEKTEASGPPEGPFLFHLHDSYPKTVIWIRKTRGMKAVLEEIYATGTYTFGVQFKAATHTWKSLEYDLADYDDGILLKKYPG